MPKPHVFDFDSKDRLDPRIAYPFPSMCHDQKLYNYMLPSPGSLHCSMGMTDALSPLSVYSFRQHELASPGSPVTPVISPVREQELDLSMKRQQKELLDKERLQSVPFPNNTDAFQTKIELDPKSKMEHDQCPSVMRVRIIFLCEHNKTCLIRHPVSCNALAE